MWLYSGVSKFSRPRLGRAPGCSGSRGPRRGWSSACRAGAGARRARSARGGGGSRARSSRPSPVIRAAEAYELRVPVDLVLEGVREAPLAVVRAAVDGLAARPRRARRAARAPARARHAHSSASAICESSDAWSRCAAVEALAPAAAAVAPQARAGVMASIGGARHAPRRSARRGRRGAPARCGGPAPRRRGRSACSRSSAPWRPCRG